MRLPILFAALALAVQGHSATAAERWTFCVAQSLDARDVWISDVFAAGADRERLEGAFKAMLTRNRAARIVAQCPSPRADKTEALNAQLAAEEFNRKLGATLHSVSTMAVAR